MKTQATEKRGEVRRIYADSEEEAMHRKLIKRKIRYFLLNDS